MRTVYFLSKAAGQQLGGQLIRTAQVEFFRRAGNRVRVVAPTRTLRVAPDEPDLLLVPVRLPLRVSNLLQHVGVVEDFLSEWSARTISVLRTMVTEQDLVFASSGGVLGCLRVGSILKELTGCRYVANLHDPISHVSLDGERFGRRLHVSRDALEQRYLSNADLIVTSTAAHADALGRKYPLLTPQLRQMYFGYVTPMSVVSRRPASPLRISYGGTFQITQSPHRLAEITADLPDVEAIFVGNHAGYRPLRRYLARARVLPALDHANYIHYLQNEVDVGFVSLADRQFRYCFPSKIFEYINAGIPILGALPDGEAASLINERGYGIAADFNDVEALRSAVTVMQDLPRWHAFRDRILADREEWSLESRMRGMAAEILGIEPELKMVGETRTHD